MSIGRIRRSRLSVLLSFAWALFLLAGCTDDSTPRSVASGSVAAVPIQIWVRDVCDALMTYQAASSPDLNLESDDALVDATMAAVLSATRALAEAVEDAGIPAVEGGDELAADLHTRLQDSVAALEAVASDVGSLPTDPAEAFLAWQDLIRPGLVTPIALSVLLAGEHPDVIVQLSDRVRASEVERLGVTLGAMDGVADVNYLDKEAACAAFREMFADQPALLEGLDCSVIPAILQVTTNTEAAPGEVVQQMEGADGVAAVVSDREREARLLALAGYSGALVERFRPLRDQARGEPACAEVGTAA